MHKPVVEVERSGAPCVSGEKPWAELLMQLQLPEPRTIPSRQSIHSFVLRAADAGLIVV